MTHLSFAWASADKVILFHEIKYAGGEPIIGIVRVRRGASLHISHLGDSGGG